AFRSSARAGARPSMMCTATCSRQNLLTMDRCLRSARTLAQTAARSTSTKIT
ncbi:hypothetical protein GGI23_007894, partial [Coemansia sp. RSA 2559]